MKHVLLIVALFVTQLIFAQQPTYRLGTALDGFAFTTADQFDSYGGNTYEVWIKEATSSGNDFLVEADNFVNKWQNNNTPFDAAYTLFFGNNASPNAVFTNAPTVGNTYIFKLKRVQPNGYVNLEAIVMEMANAPVSIDNVAQVPAGPNVPANVDVTITATLSSAPSPEENLYLRYSFDNFATYGTLAAGSTPSTAVQTFTVPGQSNGTQLDYYLFTTTLPLATLNGDQNLTDLATIDISNNGGTNFTALFPVEFQNIAVKEDARGHLLTFTTATETNNAYFQIEHSTDSRSWSKLGQLAGAGTTQVARTYEFLAATPLPGLNYYRVKQVDYAGTFNYSSIVSARWDGKTTIALFPNPVSNVLQITGLPDAGTEHTLEVIDVAGRRVLRQAWGQGTVDVSALAEGMYWLRISDADGVVEQLRFLK